MNSVSTANEVDNSKQKNASAIWGFDPAELLSKITFPNDTYEKQIRGSKDARMIAIRKLPLEILTNEEDYSAYKDTNENLRERNKLSSPVTQIKSTPYNANHKSNRRLPFNRGESTFSKYIQSDGSDDSLPCMSERKVISRNLHHSRPRTEQDPLNQTAAEFEFLSAKYESKITPATKKVRAQIARNAAAVMVQSCFRGWVIRRKFISVMYGKVSILTHGDPEKSNDGLPDTRDLTIQERLIVKYKKYCSYFNKREIVPPPEFSQFCAALIQSNWKRFVTHRAWTNISKMEKAERTKGALQFRIRQSQKMHRGMGAGFNYESSARKIQNVWRKHFNKKIFLFYKDLIRNSEHGDPQRLLKYINGKESQLIDKSVGTHVRFRLGGHEFPPTIYYKIFVNHNLVDMNAFSPRNYTDIKCKKLLPRQLFSNDSELPITTMADEWYQRFENNDWRPVSETIRKTPSIFLQTIMQPDPPTKQFHYSKLVRKTDIVKKAKMRKLKWLKSLYAKGILNEALKANKTDDNKSYDITDTMFDNSRFAHQSNNQVSIEDADAIIQEIEHDFDSEHLIKWTRALDFECYQAEWHVLATSGHSNVIDETSMMAQFGLGELLDKTYSQKQDFDSTAVTVRCDYTNKNLPLHPNMHDNEDIFD